MTILSRDQIERFWRDGVLTVEDAVSSKLLSAMREQFAAWVEESRHHDAAYGETVDGRPRFDLEPGHGPEAPALRRVNAPADVSGAYFEAMSDSRMTDMVADLIGPNMKHHHNKINSKMPGAATEVKWHQDFPFTPHSNTDLVTALLMLDDVTEENGPLEVEPGSHKGPLHSLWHQGAFTGAVDSSEAQRMQAAAMKCFAPAGSVCLMHTCVAHGSAPNLSNKPRTLFITVYSAADAFPCCPNPVPNTHEGLIVRGVDPNIIRATEYRLRPPEFPKGASFFLQQGRDREEAAR
jgi:hypothetical protein